MDSTLSPTKAANWFLFHARPVSPVILECLLAILPAGHWASSAIHRCLFAARWAPQQFERAVRLLESGQYHGFGVMTLIHWNSGFADERAEALAKVIERLADRQ